MLNPLEMERYIHAIAKRGDFQVVWNEKSKVPRTNGKKLFLPAMNNSMSEKDYQHLRHFATHEVGHVLYSDHDLLAATGLTADKSLLGAIWNLLEDHRIEYLGGREYEGDRLNGNDVYADLLGRIADKAAAGEADPKAVDTILPLLAWDNQVLADYYPSAHSVQLKLDVSLKSEDAKKRVEKLANGKFAEELRRVRQIVNREKGTAATLDLAKRVFEEVYEQDAKKEMDRVKQEMQKQQGKDGKGESKEGEGEGAGEGEGKPKPGDGDGEPVPRNEFVSLDYSELMPDKHVPNDVKHGMHLDYSKHEQRHDYRPLPAKDYVVHDYTSSSGYDDGDYSTSINSALSRTSSGFAHKVRSILQIRDRDRYQYGLKRGHLNQSSLYRVTVPDAPGFNERVFKNKTTNDVLNAAVTLVVDQSGSMSGDKFAHAAAAAVMMNDVIGNVLHIPCEIVSFTTDDHMHEGHTAIGIMRKHQDRLVSRDTLIRRFSQATGGMSLQNNLDGEAIIWAFDRLMQRKEKRKLLIVFSDGSPAGYGRGDIVGYTADVIRSIENESPVSIVGIGIMDDNVERFYKESKVINKTHELESALLSVIEGKLK